MFKDKFQERKRSLLKTLVNNSSTYSVEQATYVEHTHWARASVCLSVSLNIRVNKQTPGVVAHHFSLHPSGSWANTFDTVQPRVYKRWNTSRAYYIEVRAKNIQPLARFLEVSNQRTVYNTSCSYASKKSTSWCTLIPRVKWLKAGIRRPNQLFLFTKV